MVLITRSDLVLSDELLPLVHSLPFVSDTSMRLVARV